MNKKKIAGNSAMIFSKTCSGLNQNALRYLTPTWFSPYTGVFLRTGFAAFFFWAAAWCKHKKPGEAQPTLKHKLTMMVVSGSLVFGYMFSLLLGLSYTTPIASSICVTTQPIWVFLMCVVLYKNKVTFRKVAGIILGLAGAWLIIATQKGGEHASDPILGDFICLISAFLYAIFLVVISRYLTQYGQLTVSKWVFLGASCFSAVLIPIFGWYAPVLSQPLFSAPMLVLGFVLIFASAVGYLLLVVGEQYLTPTVVAMYGYLILIVSAVASYILGQDKFDWWQVVSMAMIVASVWMVESSDGTGTSGKGAGAAPASASPSATHPNP